MKTGEAASFMDFKRVCLVSLMFIDISGEPSCSNPIRIWPVFTSISDLIQPLPGH